MADSTEAGTAIAPPRELLPESQVVAIVDIAIREYQHAEAVVQSRLYNFLFAESILLLSWAAVFATNDIKGRRIVLTVLALLATVLGIVWAFVGGRHKAFLQLHTHIVRTLELRLPAAMRIHEPISQLQDGAVLTIDDRKTLAIGPLLRFFGERNLGTIAPLVMALGAAILLYVALTQ